MFMQIAMAGDVINSSFEWISCILPLAVVGSTESRRRGVPGPCSTVSHGSGESQAG